MHKLSVDFGGDLKMTFNLTDWELNRVNELQNQGIPLQQALAQARGELRSFGSDHKAIRQDQ